MKSIKLIVAGMLLFLAGSMQAQVSVNVNIGAPPLWGPVGYNDVRFYYLPDVEAYYDVQSSMFIYLDGGSWVHRGYLPSRYGNYDLYGGYKVVMKGYHGNDPYSHFTDHRKKYGRGYHDGNQKTIGQRPGKGNQGGKASHENSHGNKGGDPGNSKNSGHGNNKGDRGHGGDNGKKK
jgi:hypothetical protein